MEFNYSPADDPPSTSRFPQAGNDRKQLAVTAAQCLVELETALNLLLDHFWDHDYHRIYVIPPLVVKSSRGRQGPMGIV